MRVLIAISLFMGATLASAQSEHPKISCYKMASLDPQILSAAKSTPHLAGKLEQLVSHLCNQATATNDPLECFKAAMRDPDVLISAKASLKNYKDRYPQDAGFLEVEVEMGALNLCGGSELSRPALR